MSGLTPKLTSVFADAYDRIRNGDLRTLIPFLCLFRINGRPMTLKSHYQFSPLYGTVQPVQTVFMTGRQIGKSFSICSDMLLRSMLIPYYHTVVVQPRADQIQRLIGTVYKPMLSSCPIHSSFISSTELQKLSLREFNNHSLCYADYCFLSPDRLRGISGACSTFIDEVQDVDFDFIPVINETMSASLFWGFSVYTGTPKTTDTTLALLWNKSSQAEWVIKCTHCNNYNVPNPEHDLIKMLDNRGLVCAKCNKLVNPRNGGYVHAVPDRMHTFPGYHVSQTIHPLHVLHESKWQRLMAKVNDYDQLTLFNEVFGWPYDAATSPLTMRDMQRATHDIRITSPSQIESIAHQYRYITVGVDWGGGGAISDSYTAYAVLGLRAGDDVIDVLYGKRIPKNVAPTDEVHEIMHWIIGTGADALAFDNGGAGFTRLEMMKQAGLLSIPNITVVPINYVAPRSGDVMSPHTGQREPDLYFYSLDKSRSLAVCVTAIKGQRIRFPKFAEEDEKAYQRDFLALREDPSKSARNEVVILITKKPGVPDDFAHAVNFGCSQIWDHFGAYPRIGSRYDTSILDLDENNNQILPDEVFGPRGDFDRFREAVDARTTVVDIGDRMYDDLE